MLFLCHLTASGTHFCSIGNVLALLNLGLRRGRLPEIGHGKHRMSTLQGLAQRAWIVKVGLHKDEKEKNMDQQTEDDIYGLELAKIPSAVPGHIPLHAR